MRIKSVHIVGFGKWVDQSFDFDEQFQIFYGLNEAGKSTLRQFLKSMFFGFPSSRAKGTNTYEPQSGAKYGGSMIIEVSQNETYRISRFGRRQTKVTIENLTTQQSIDNPEQWLTELLAPVDELLFDEIFSFDQQQLNEIVELEENDLNGHLLRMGSAGSETWLDEAQSLKKQAGQSLGLTKTAKRPLNMMLKQYDQLGQNIQAVQQELPEYRQLQLNLDQLKVRQQELSAAYQENQQKEQIARRLMTNLPFYEQLLALGDSRSADDALDLKSYAELANELQTNDAKIAAIETQLDKTTQKSEETAHTTPAESESSAFYETYLSQKPELDNLKNELGNIAAIAIRLNQLRERRQSLINARQQLEQQFGGKVPKPVPNELNQQILNPQKRVLNKSRWLGLNFLFIAVLLLVAGLSTQAITMRYSLLAGGVGLLVAGVVIVMRQLFIKRQLPDTAEQLRQLGYSEELSYEQIQVLQTAVQSHRINQEQIQSLNDQIKTLDKEAQRAIDFTTQLTPFSKTAYSGDRLNRLVEDANHYFAHLEQVTQEQQRLKADQQAQMNLNEALKQKLNSQRDALTATQHAILSRARAIDRRDFDQKYEQSQKDSKQQLRRADLEEQIGTEELALYRQLNPSELINFDRELERLMHTSANQQSELNQLRERIAELNAQLTQMVSDESYQRLRQEQADLQTQIIAGFEVYLTQMLSAEWIEETLSIASSDRFPRIMRQAEKYFELLTNHHYRHISFVEQQIKVVDTRGEQFTVNQISKGTSEQLYVALRLAFVDILSDVSGLPIIVDDGFVNFDVGRKAATLELLNQMSQKRQVIYFTADQQIQQEFDSTVNLNDF